MKISSRKGMTPITSILILVGVIIIGYGAYQLSTKGPSEEKVSGDAPWRGGEETVLPATDGEVKKDDKPVVKKTDPVAEVSPLKIGGIDLAKVAFTVDSKPFVLGTDSVTKEVRKVLWTVVGDLNRDGKQDVGVVLSQSSAGTGTFFYATLVTGSSVKPEATNVFFLGDRITIQTFTMEDNQLVVRYLDRKSDEPMSAVPLIPRRKAFFLSGTALVEDIK